MGARYYGRLIKHDLIEVGDHNGMVVQSTGHRTSFCSHKHAARERQYRREVDGLLKTQGTIGRVRVDQPSAGKLLGPLLLPKVYPYLLATPMLWSFYQYKSKIIPSFKIKPFLVLWVP